MRSLALFVAAMAAPLLPVCAQPPEVYKVELTMRDAADASAKAGRHYLILIDTHGNGMFKIGSREPVATGSFQPSTGGTGINPLVNTQYTYIDTGVNIECRLEQAEGGRMQLRTDLDLSGILQGKGAAPSVPNPAIGQMKLVVTALLIPGKKTVVASFDDPVTSRKFDLEALVTKAE
jgi:hypothetical protein